MIAINGGYMRNNILVDYTLTEHDFDGNIDGIPFHLGLMRIIRVCDKIDTKMLFNFNLVRIKTFTYGDKWVFVRSEDSCELESKPKGWKPKRIVRTYFYRICDPEIELNIHVPTISFIKDNPELNFVD